MINRRLLLSASALVAVAVAGVVVMAMLPPRPGITRMNIDRIQVGMAKDRVEAILGSPGNHLHGMGIGEWRLWRNPPRASVAICFDEKDCVTEIARGEFHPDQLTFMDRLWKWLW